MQGQLRRTKMLKRELELQVRLLCEIIKRRKTTSNKLIVALEKEYDDDDVLGELSRLGHHPLNPLYITKTDQMDAFGCRIYAIRLNNENKENEDA
jgi:hypothetical protein